MSERDCHEKTLLEAAAAGDLSALERLLLDYHDRLVVYLNRKLPASLRGQLDSLDVIQECYVEAFRRIRDFKPDGEEAFFRWLCTIARHRLLDAIKAHRAAKRSGQWRRLDDAGASDPAVVNLVELLAVDQHTPSRSVAGHEAVRAVQAALASLPEDYREAIHLRHIERLPVAEVALRMGRSESAVHSLLRRGLDRMRETLGKSSRYFSQT